MKIIIFILQVCMLVIMFRVFNKINRKSLSEKYIAKNIIQKYSDQFKVIFAIFCILAILYFI